MINDYQDWCYLNEEGMKEYGHIFPNKTIPIVSMIGIKFEHPKLEEPELAYLLRGTDLTEEQIEKLIKNALSRFDELDKEVIKTTILTNQVPIRQKLTSGAGTKRIFMYMSDYDGEFQDEGWEEDWEEDDLDSW